MCQIRINFDYITSVAALLVSQWGPECGGIHEHE